MPGAGVDGVWTQLDVVGVESLDVVRTSAPDGVDDLHAASHERVRDGVLGVRHRHVPTAGAVGIPAPTTVVASLVFPVGLLVFRTKQWWSSVCGSGSYPRGLSTPSEDCQVQGPLSSRVGSVYPYTHNRVPVPGLLRLGLVRTGYWWWSP